MLLLEAVKNFETDGTYEVYTFTLESLAIYSQEKLEQRRSVN